MKCCPHLHTHPLISDIEVGVVTPEWAIIDMRYDVGIMTASGATRLDCLGFPGTLSTHQYIQMTYNGYDLRARARQSSRMTCLPISRVRSKIYVSDSEHYLF